MNWRDLVLLTAQASSWILVKEEAQQKTEKLDTSVWGEKGLQKTESGQSDSPISTATSNQSVVDVWGH